MAYSYIVSALHPTAVIDCATARWTASDEKNLIVAKVNSLDIFLVVNEQLNLLTSFPINGKILNLKILHPKDLKQDLIFILTEKQQFCILEYDTNSKQVITKANGDIFESTQNLKLPFIAAVDPESQTIILQTHEEKIKVIPIDSSGVPGVLYQLKFHNKQTLDIKFMHNTTPTLAFLAQEENDLHVLLHCLSHQERELASTPWDHRHIDPETCMLVPIPLPYGGLVIVGEHTLLYQNGSITHEISMTPSQICAYDFLDPSGSCILFGNHYGHLFTLTLIHNNSQIIGLRTENIGTVSIPSCISYLGDGICYIGSQYGNPQLIKILPNKNENGSLVQVLEDYNNIGPIFDMCLVDLNRQGQGQLVTCSGVEKDGSLRIIRTGIGLEEQAAIELPGIKNMWSLRPFEGSVFDKFLVQSFVGETRILAIEEEQMEETEIPGFEQGETLFCGNMIGNTIIQVSRYTVSLVSCETLEKIFEWKTFDSHSIILASANASQLVLALSGGLILSFELDTATNTLVEKAQSMMGNEISCINLNPLHVVDDTNDAIISELPNRNELVAVGLWNDFTIEILALPSLEKITKVRLGSDIQARSVLFATLDTAHYLFVGLGDGQLIFFEIEFSNSKGIPTFGSMKKISFGVHPISLCFFYNNMKPCIFISCDRPTIVYSTDKKKLSYATINMQQVDCMCPFHSELFPNSIALNSQSSLFIGTIDNVQQLHIRTIPLNAQPRRIIYDTNNRLFVVGLLKVNIRDNNEQIQYCLQFIDDTTFEVLQEYTFHQNESVLSIKKCNFDVFENKSRTISRAEQKISEKTAQGKNDEIEQPDDECSKNEFIVVGTAGNMQSADYPLQGRILVFDMNPKNKQALERNVEPICELAVNGSVSSLSELKGSLLAGISSKIEIFKLVHHVAEGGLYELQREESEGGWSFIRSTDSYNNFFIAADIIKSISMFQFNPYETTKIKRVAEDYTFRSVDKLLLFDEETVFCSDDLNNIINFQRNNSSIVEEDNIKLQEQGRFHFGSTINKFLKGPLVPLILDVSSHNCDVLHPESSIIFGTVDGGIGMIYFLKEDAFHFFKSLQTCITKVVPPIGGLRFDYWRNCRGKVKQISSRHFIDGDLVETFLDLKEVQMQQIVDLMKQETTSNDSGDVITLFPNLKIDDVIDRVREMIRLR